MSNSLNSITQLINDAKNKKLYSEEEYNSFMNMIKNDIKTIENILEEYNE